MWLQPLVGHGLLIVEISWSHSDTPHSVVLLWTSDQPETEASTWQHTTLTRDRHPRFRRDSNPLIPASEQLHTLASGRAATGVGFCANKPVGNRTLSHSVRGQSLTANQHIVGWLHITSENSCVVDKRMHLPVPQGLPLLRTWRHLVWYKFTDFPPKHRWTLPDYEASRPSCLKQF